VPRSPEDANSEQNKFKKNKISNAKKYFALPALSKTNTFLNVTAFAEISEEVESQSPRLGGVEGRNRGKMKFDIILQPRRGCGYPLPRAPEIGLPQAPSGRHKTLIAWLDKPKTDMRPRAARPQNPSGRRKQRLDFG
jgi:hypothetical protein